MFPTKGDLRRLQQQIDALVCRQNSLEKEFHTMSDATGAQIAHIQNDVNQMGQDAANVSISVGAIQSDLDAIKAEIDALKAAPGQLTPANQAALDALSASADSAMTNADTALAGANNIKTTADAMTPPPPPPPAPAP
jgi:seryl-tRNA synthetase